MGETGVRKGQERGEQMEEEDRGEKARKEMAKDVDGLRQTPKLPPSSRVELSQALSSSFYLNHRQMAAVTPRASGLWEYSDMTYSRLSAHDPSDDSEENKADSRTPLDRTIDQIGMGTFFFSPLGPCLQRLNLAVFPLGTYQWALLFLCGFGG